MAYSYPSYRIAEILRAAKCLRQGEQVEVKSKGEHGAGIDVNLDLLDGPFTDLRYPGNASDLTEPQTYKANLLLAAQKVRGVDFHPVGQRRWFKQRVPAGWHQDIRDPNLPTTDDNQHRREPLPDFAPSDFKDFIRRTTKLWNIDLAWEESML